MTLGGHDMVIVEALLDIDVVAIVAVPADPLDVFISLSSFEGENSRNILTFCSGSDGRQVMIAAIVLLI